MGTPGLLPASTSSKQPDSIAHGGILAAEESETRSVFMWHSWHSGKRFVSALRCRFPLLSATALSCCNAVATDLTHRSLVPVSRLSRASARMVKLVDTSDLKSAAYKMAYGFDPRSGHHQI